MVARVMISAVVLAWSGGKVEALEGRLRIVAWWGVVSAG